MDTAKDGQMGLQLATDVGYDLIILDLILPGITGPDILRRVRQTNPSVPVLVLTARSMSFHGRTSQYQAPRLSGRGAARRSGIQERT